MTTPSGSNPPTNPPASTTPKAASGPPAWPGTVNGWKPVVWWLWLWLVMWIKRGWPIWLSFLVLFLIDVTSRNVRQAVLESVPTYGNLGSGSRYCTDLASALVGYSGFSRRCAWVAFFVGVLLGGFAVVIGPDDKEDPQAGYWTKLCTKHRNVVMLLVAAVFWTTAYAGFVRIGAAAEAAQVLTKHVSDSESKHASWNAVLLDPAKEEKEKKRLEEMRTAILDRELFSKCIATRGTWEVSRTKSFDFARSVALAQATSLLDRQRAAGAAGQQADQAQEKRQGALEQVAKAEQAAAAPAAGAETEVGRAEKAADSAEKAAAAVSLVEREAVQAANLAAGVDPIVVAALRERIATLRSHVQKATDSSVASKAASETLKAGPPPDKASALTATAIKSAGDSADASRRALTTAAQLVDSVQAVVATEQAAATAK